MECPCIVLKNEPNMYLYCEQRKFFHFECPMKCLLAQNPNFFSKLKYILYYAKLNEQLKDTTQGLFIYDSKNLDVC